jgi:hypothetical protein
MKLIGVKFVSYKNNINTHYEKVKLNYDDRVICLYISGM